MKTHHREFKGPLYEQFARVARAVANPHRLELIDLLAQGERRVDDLAQEVGLSIANASQHLQTLRHAGLVESRREGTAIYYRLADDEVVRLWQAIRAVGEARLAELDVLTRLYLHDRAQLDAIDAATLRRRIVEGDVVVLDVRPELEYRAAHIAGARSIPITELANRLEEVPRELDVVAYCRGPYCLFSDEAVTLLRKRGYRARRLDVGLPDWQLAGMPTETSDAARERSTS
jgi:DNA-binding transcriptional ArsR family regulator/rhodanese-related sulfurtransferase